MTFRKYTSWSGWLENLVGRSRPTIGVCMSSNGLLEVWENLSKPRIMVLGDLMLDRYTWGNAERISQEAPVVVLRADRRKAQPGGAANVANMLAVLESRVTCCGVVGGDV